MMKHFAAATATAALLTVATAVPMPTMGAAQAKPAKGCSDGKNRRVRMVNATSYTIQRLYGSNESQTTWQEDVLGDSVLRPGTSVVVNWDDGSCYCVFDFKATYSDGDKSEKRGVDVCKLESFRFTD